MKNPTLCTAAALLATLLLPACRSVEQKAPPVMGLRTSAPEQCEEGRHIFVSQCTECHGLKDVRSRTITEWRAEVLPRMAAKAKLSPHQEAAVLAYFSAVLEMPRPAARANAPLPGPSGDSFSW